MIKCPKNNTKNKEKFKKKNRIVLKNDENIGAVTYIKKKNKIEICLNPKKQRTRAIYNELYQKWRSRSCEKTYLNSLNSAARYSDMILDRY